MDSSWKWFILIRVASLSPALVASAWAARRLKQQKRKFSILMIDFCKKKSEMEILNCCLPMFLLSRKRKNLNVWRSEIFCRLLFCLVSLLAVHAEAANARLRLAILVKTGHVHKESHGRARIPRKKKKKQVSIRDQVPGPNAELRLAQCQVKRMSG